MSRRRMSVDYESVLRAAQQEMFCDVGHYHCPTLREDGAIIFPSGIVHPDGTFRGARRLYELLQSPPQQKYNLYLDGYMEPAGLRHYPDGVPCQISALSSAPERHLDAALAYWRAVRTKKRYLAGEPDILVSPKWAYLYMRDVIIPQGDHWPAGEDLIAQHPRRAYMYALNVIHDRWPAGEQAIAQHPRWAYQYAHDLVRSRWPAGEPVIAQHPQWACYYAQYVIRCRFHEAEPVIAQDPQWAEYYASYIIHGRFPEAEPVIAQHPRWAVYYAETVLYRRFPEAEPVIARHPRWAYEYARTVIHGRWPAGEQAIAQHPRWAYFYTQICDQWPRGKKAIRRTSAAPRSPRDRNSRSAPQSLTWTYQGVLGLPRTWTSPS